MPHDPDILVVLTSAATEFEAQALAEALRARGVPSEVFATATNTLQWQAGYTDPIKVMVRRADLEAAGAIRASLKADSVDIDWDEVDTGATPAGENDARPRPSKLVTRIGVEHLRARRRADGRLHRHERDAPGVLRGGWRGSRVAPAAVLWSVHRSGNAGRRVASVAEEVTAAGPVSRVPITGRAGHSQPWAKVRRRPSDNS